MSKYNQNPSWPPQQSTSGYGPPPPPSSSPWQQQNPNLTSPPMGYPQPSGYPQSSAYPQPSGYPHSSAYPAPPNSAYPPPPHSGYPPPQGGLNYHLFPPGTDPEVVRLFQDADRDGSGSADEFELQRVLSYSQPFSVRTVRLMIHMFGSNNATKLGPMEFVTLFKALKDWKGIFERFDRDKSGSIDKGEIRDALLSLGYSISPPIVDCLISKYDRSGKAKAMDYDSFVECGLIVKGLTEKFKAQDKQMKGSATLDYQTFMLMVLPFIVA